MARGTVLWSDKSGEMIKPGTGARVRIMFYDDKRVDMRADLSDAEVAKLVREYKLKDVEPRPERAGEKRVKL
jgi:hypothetical protein